MKRILGWLILCLIGVGRGNAENVLFYDSKQLTCDLVTSICQDKDGFIWIGTDYGLNKFNGVQFTHYYSDPKDNTSLLDNSVQTLFLDKEGTLWIGGVSGLQYYVPEEDVFRRVTFVDRASVHVKNIFQLRSGEIWVASSGKGVYRISDDKKSAMQIKDIPQISEYSYFSQVYEDNEGMLWLGIDEVGLLRYDSAGHKSKIYTKNELRGGSLISCVTEDLSGNLLVSTAIAAYYLDKQQDKFVEITLDESWLHARAMLTSKNGTRYLATYGKGLKVISQDLTEVYPDPVSIPFFDLANANIRAIYEDRNQNLWLGCYYKGIVMISKEPTPFRFWSINERLFPKAGVVTIIGKDKDENILGGVENGGVFKLDLKKGVIEHLFEGQTFSSLYLDAYDNLWLGGKFCGLYIKTPAGKMSSLFPEIKNRDIKAISGDDKEYVYISVYGDGFMQYHLPTQKVVWYRESSEGLKNNWINSFLYSSRSLLWIAHCYGIDCFNPQTAKFDSLPAAFSGFVAYSLLEDVESNIWIGTNKGLICYNPRTGEQKLYDREDGLSNNVVYGLAEDEHGNIWCSTLKGINQIKVKDGGIISYYSERGLVDNEYMKGACYQATDGMIYYGGIKGITYFHPDSIGQQRPQSDIMLSNLYVGGERVPMKRESDNIRLAYEDNTFTLEFSTFDYRNAGNTFYEYRIREYGKEWSSTQPGTNQITYNHLNSGNYIFEVRACGNGQYSQVKTIRIHIAPPWWRSLPAYMCYLALLLIALCQIYFMVRRRHQKILNEEKIKLFINLSHEIRSPMTLIISPLENLLRREYDAETMKLLRLIQKNANRIVNLMNQLLDMRKIEKGQMQIRCKETDMVGFIQELISLFAYQAQKRDINLHFEYHKERVPAWVDRNNFDKVLMNLLSNAFKYTPDGGEIKISLRERTDERATGILSRRIEIEVADSGTGIDANKLEKIFERFYQTPDNSHGSLGFGIGLNLCRMIVNLHHGVIFARNREDEAGSRFIIYLPSGNEHLKKNELAEEDKIQPAVAPAYILPGETEEEENAKQKYYKTNYRVVIVDDDSEIRNFLETELGRHYKVYVCTNGKEGLQTILQVQPELVISDVIMPELDGISLLKALRNNPNVSHIPVILLTSKAEYADRLQGLSKGADVYLAKPFNLEELKVHIKNLIETRLLLKGKYSGAQDQEGKIEMTENKSSDERLMERVMAVINKHMDNPEFNVEMMAREVGLSRVQLHRKLKDITGVPASTFIRNLRMKKAAALLQEHKLNIAEVADAVGFDNQANFSTAFKKQYGVTPTEYIVQAKNEKPFIENESE